MADTRLRALERAWLESGDPRDEAQLLLERLRQGELTPERLELCAYLGHEPAIIALGDEAPAGEFATLSFARRVDLVVLVRALAGLARASMDAIPFADARVLSLLDAFDGWRGEVDPEYGARWAILWASMAQTSTLEVLLQPLITIRGACELIGSTEHTREHALTTALRLIRSHTDSRINHEPLNGLLHWALGDQHSMLPSQRDPADAEARYLMARLRAGSLTIEQMTLAAYADYEPARRALGREAPAVPADIVQWTDGLASWEPDPRTRAVFAAAATRPWDSQETWLDAPVDHTTPVVLSFAAHTTRLLDRALESMQHWLDDPGPDETALVAQIQDRMGWLRNDPAFAAAPESLKAMFDLVAEILRSPADPSSAGRSLQRLSLRPDGAVRLQDARRELVCVALTAPWADPT